MERPTKEELHAAIRYMVALKENVVRSQHGQAYAPDIQEQADEAAVYVYEYVEALFAEVPTDAA